MNPTNADTTARTLSAPLADRAAFGALDRALRSRLLRQMSGLAQCQLRLVDALGDVTLGTPAAPGGNGTPDGIHGDTLRATIEIHDPAFYRYVAGNGSVGAGEAYIDGLWRSDDPVALMRMLVRNRHLLDAMETGLARFGGVALRAWHALKRNTRGGSQRNIAAHYDLGNEFFRLWLDESLM